MVVGKISFKAKRTDDLVIQSVLYMLFASAQSQVHYDSSELSVCLQLLSVYTEFAFIFSFICMLTQDML